MNLDSIRIKNDLYLDKWIQTLVPLMNKNETLERFWEANIEQKNKAQRIKHKEGIGIKSSFRHGESAIFL